LLAALLAALFLLPGPWFAALGAFIVAAAGFEWARLCRLAGWAAWLYAAAMAIVGVIMLTALMLRPELEVNVLHDRNPLAVRLKDGGVRNGYTIRFSNKKPDVRRFSLSVAGVPGAQTEVVGVPADARGKVMIEVGADQTREARVLLSTHGPAAAKGQTPVVFTVTDASTGAALEVKDVFITP